MSDTPTLQDRLDWTIQDNARKAIRIADLENQLSERDAALARCVEALQELGQWAEAYPVNVFPEPDFNAVRVALESAGLSLDSVSASNMRHVITGVKKIVEAALSASTQAGTDDIG